VTVLDVGQGLAVHVQTAAHDLIYDTGPAFSADANSGERILLPYLRAAGVRRCTPWSSPIRTMTTLVVPKPCWRGSRWTRCAAPCRRITRFA
jgi:hypothetical protein